MQIKPSDPLRIITHSKEDPQPAILDLLVNQELGKAPVDLVLRATAVRAEQVSLRADRVIKRALLLAPIRFLGIAQLELLNPTLDRPHDREQMQ